LRVSDLQLREDHWIIADLLGKAKHVRTVPVPRWVKNAVDDWRHAASISNGYLFRKVARTNEVWGERLSAKAIWHIVKRAAKRAGIDRLAPHDLRRYAECPTMPNAKLQGATVTGFIRNDSA
jgi:integrase